jgi:hypothetical protein
MRVTDEETHASPAERGEIAVDRVDRLAEWLELTLGTRLTAYASGISTRELVQIAHGHEQPDPDAEQRLRNLFAVASMLAVRDGAGSACEFLTAPNADLEGRSPAALLHEGGSPESVWFAAAPVF